MKKTLLTCLAIVALFAIAGSASAITCTIDQRPAATLLVPFFQVGVNPDFSVVTGPNALDTIVVIGNASSAPMLAHVNVFNNRSVLVLDFNIALTGFDVQSMNMSLVLGGHLPATPVSTDHVKPDVTDIFADACQRNGPPNLSGSPPSGKSFAAVYPASKGFLRIRPIDINGSDTADPNDNTLATTLYPDPAFSGQFLFDLWDSLDTTADSRGCGDTPFHSDNVLAGPLVGYITIDHVNYCNLSNPNAASYYSADAIGNENNLFGEVIFTSGAGIPTVGGSTVNIESSRTFSDSVANGGNGGNTTSDTARDRTFYARYWTPSTETFTNAAHTNCATGSPAGINCFASNPWNRGFGDEREPTGLKFAARYFEGNGVTSFLRVWRASSGTLTDLTGTVDPDTGNNLCNVSERTVNLTFFDEDENTFQAPGQPPCPSPCIIPPTTSLNFPKETQRVSVIGTFAATLPPAFAGSQNGWVSMSFVNLGSAANNNGLLDQAWVEYDYVGATAFISASAPATQLDPKTCNPLLIPVAGATGGFAMDIEAVFQTVPGTRTGAGHAPCPPGFCDGRQNPPVGTGK